MTTEMDGGAIAAELLYREGQLLDDRHWMDWLTLYTEDARFWIPAWIDEHELTDDPDRQVSMIYITSRRELAERVSRTTSRKSVTAMPLPRTMHLVGNIQPVSVQPDRIVVRANGTVTSYHPRTATAHVIAARYSYLLRFEEQQWRIASKKTVVINDRLPGMVDFYSI